MHMCVQVCLHAYGGQRTTWCHFSRARHLIWGLPSGRQGFACFHFASTENHKSVPLRPSSNMGSRVQTKVLTTNTYPTKLSPQASDHANFNSHSYNPMRSFEHHCTCALPHKSPFSTASEHSWSLPVVGKTWPSVCLLHHPLPLLTTRMGCSPLSVLSD